MAKVSNLIRVFNAARRLGSKIGTEKDIRTVRSAKPQSVSVEVNSKQWSSIMGKLRQLEAYPDLQNKALEAAGKDAVQLMYEDAPKDTRRLATNIRYKVKGDNLNIQSYAINPKDPDKVDYAPIQEYGLNPYIRTTPYFRKNYRFVFNELKKLLSLWIDDISKPKKK